MYQQQGYLAGWEIGGVTIGAGATAKAIGLIPPFMGGPGRQRALWDFRTNKGLPATTQPGITHIERLIASNGSTAQQITIMRPLNYSWITTAIAKNGTAIVGMQDDPGIFSTNYKYDGVISQGTAVVADHGIQANDYVVYQLADGTWEQGLITSGTFGSSLTLTSGAGGNSATLTGGGIAAGAPLYYFGPLTAASAAFASQLKDPATGQVPIVLTLGASSAPTLTSGSPYISNGPGGFFSALHPGDPLLVAITSLTAAPTIDLVCGWYGKY